MLAMPVKDLREVIDYLKDDTEVFIGKEKVVEKIKPNIPKNSKENLKSKLRLTCNDFATKLTEFMCCYSDDITYDVQRLVEGISDIMDDLKHGYTIRIIYFTGIYMKFSNKFDPSPGLDALHGKIVYLSTVINEHTDFVDDYRFITNRDSAVCFSNFISDAGDITDELFTLLRNDLKNSVIDPVEYHGCEKFITTMIQKFYGFKDELEVDGLNIEIMTMEKIQTLVRYFENASNTKMKVTITTKMEFYKLITLYNKVLSRLIEEAIK